MHLHCVWPASLSWHYMASASPVALFWTAGRGWRKLCPSLKVHVYLPVTYLACVIIKQGRATVPRHLARAARSRRRDTTQRWLESGKRRKKEIVSNMCGRGQETKREWKRTGVFFRLLSNLVTSSINHQLSWLYIDILKKSAHIKAIFRISKSAHVSSNNANKTTEHKHTDIKCSYNRLKGTSKHR